MEIRLHDDLETFAGLALPLLRADPVRNTVAISVLTAHLRPDAPGNLTHLITVHEDGEVAGVALQSSGWAMIVSALPVRFAPALASLLAERGPQPHGVSGPRPEAEAFAEAWLARTGQGRRDAMGQRLFALQKLTPPTGVAGGPRLATLEDVELLVRWRNDFADDALPPSWPRAGAEAVARQLRAGQGNVLWVAGGLPVAMATASLPSAGMSRIGPVWTPRPHRNRGFGSAVTAAASRWALDAGARHVVLYTDLSNPVSNAIYPRIGYRPQFDALELAFDR